MIKDQMNPILIALALILAGILAWNSWSNAQTDLAIAKVRATAAGQSVSPSLSAAADSVMAVAYYAVVAVAVLAVLSFGFLWMRKQWLRQNAAYGVNRYQPQQRTGYVRGNRPMSEAEMFRAMLMERMTGGSRPRVQAYQPDDDNEILL